MRQRQRAGNRYLAGLVIAFAAIYLALTAAEVELARLYWPDFVLVGLVPAVIAAWLGIRGWSSPAKPSTLYSAIGLVVLVVAMALKGLTTVIF